MVYLDDTHNKPSWRSPVVQLSVLANYSRATLSPIGPLPCSPWLDSPVECCMVIPLPTFRNSSWHLLQREHILLNYDLYSSNSSIGLWCRVRIISLWTWVIGLPHYINISINLHLQIWSHALESTIVLVGLTSRHLPLLLCSNLKLVQWCIH
jgi:hypothetical protein